MKIKSNTGNIYEIQVNRTGENHLPCPECSKDRKKQNAKSFSFNLALGVGRCHHCGVSFHAYREPEKRKEYKIPEWKNRTALSDNAAKWFRGRMIFDDVLNRMNVSSAVEFMPQILKETTVICFPYYRNGELVNIKYRDGAKHFKLVKDAELVFYNLDAATGSKELVIVEGEIDCLSFIQAGIQYVVSVPNGAGSKSMEYIDNCIDDFALIERFYIATDNDGPGIDLKNELIRRLGPERCCTVDFKDCKDANEYLVKYGGFELGEVLKAAKDVPVEGVTTCDKIYTDIYDLYLNGFQPGACTGLSRLDQLVTWSTGRLAIITGIPGHGKSEIVDQIVVMLNLVHGWKAAYFSPENHPLSYHFGKIAAKISGKSFDHNYMNHAEFEAIYNHIQENIYFIAPENDISVESIIEKAKYLVRKSGIKQIVIDPYNRLDHLQDRGESETQYISRFLDKLTNFARMNGVLVYLVAHPRKMNLKKDGSLQYEVPTLYDINGSANFFNKADYGLTVYRNKAENKVEIHVQKVKFKHWGTTGDVDFEYNAVNGRIYNPGETLTYNNWLNKMECEQPVIQSNSFDDDPF